MTPVQVAGRPDLCDSTASARSLLRTERWPVGLARSPAHPLTTGSKPVQSARLLPYTGGWDSNLFRSATLSLSRGGLPCLQLEATGPL